MKEKPNYYAIIPAEVRYSNLKPNAKLLYGEITALSNKTGYCFASNNYFAELYNVNKNTISRWISDLKRLGFITIEIERAANKQIIKRCLGIVQKVDNPIYEKVKGNTTSINTTSNNTIHIRAIYFADEVHKNKEYSKDMLSDFVSYWTEMNKSETKLRYELQKTWNTNLRLKNWAKNQKKWDKPKQTMSKIHQHLQKNLNVKERLKKQFE